ncbi:AAA family ATPase, partial [Candidatus Gracilibacteria bacterium]|nr:AAA family ATPase [Candidatus Gracilibacteria bacterium]
LYRGAWPQLLSMWIGESERGVREVFRKARQAAPCIIFFDEIDALVAQRGAPGDNQATERIVSQLLVEMDGLVELKGVVVLAATNRPDRIDAALLRPGRFDLVVEMPVPDFTARVQMLNIHTARMRLADNIDFEELAGRINGFVGADIEGLCRRAGLAAVRSRLGSNATELVVERVHFETALEELALPIEGLAKR